MVRNVLGSILALAGAAAAVWSPFRDWYDGRPGRDYRIQDFFNGITDTGAALASSVLLPFAFAALITVLGVLLRSRLLVALSGLIVLGFTVLWMVRQGQAAGSLSVGDGGGLGDGVALAAGGGVVLLLAALVMSGRPRPAGRDLDGEPHTVSPEDDWGPYGPDPTGPVPYRRGPYELRPDERRPGDGRPGGDHWGPDGPPTLPGPGPGPSGPGPGQGRGQRDEQ